MTADARMRKVRNHARTRDRERADGATSFKLPWACALLLLRKFDVRTVIKAQGDREPDTHLLVCDIYQRLSSSKSVGARII